MSCHKHGRETARVPVGSHIFWVYLVLLYNGSPDHTLIYVFYWYLGKVCPRMIFYAVRIPLSKSKTRRERSVNRGKASKTWLRECDRYASLYNRPWQTVGYAYLIRYNNSTIIPGTRYTVNISRGSSGPACLCSILKIHVKKAGYEYEYIVQYLSHRSRGCVFHDCCETSLHRRKGGRMEPPMLALEISILINKAFSYCSWPLLCTLTKQQPHHHCVRPLECRAAVCLARPSQGRVARLQPSNCFIGRDRQRIQHIHSYHMYIPRHQLCTLFLKPNMQPAYTI